MILLRTIAVAFAQYSRIPMPRFEWKEKDMKYSMAAFPLVGAVIGLLYTALYCCCRRFAVPASAAALLLTALPVIITGGFHIDGFMDVSDALNSYRSVEEKLAILKDPHVGAFAVIRLALAGLICIASVIIVISEGAPSAQADSDRAMRLVVTLAAGFVLARALSALAVLTFRSAKNKGMLYYEATSAAAARGVNIAFSLIWIAIAAGVMLFSDLTAGAAETGAALICFMWYKYKSYKEFGGITGDTAGWFVVICETAIAAAAAIASLLI